MAYMCVCVYGWVGGYVSRIERLACRKSNVHTPMSNKFLPNQLSSGINSEHAANPIKKELGVLLSHSNLL